MRSVLRCPRCHASLEATEQSNESCLACGFVIERVGDIPILLANRKAIEDVIEEARSGIRRGWYEGSHDDQWSGPYRHHLLKRKAYVEDVLRRRAGGTKFEVGLDLGCGDGSNARWIAAFTNDLWGLDYNSLRLVRAKSVRALKHLFVADVTDLPVIDGAFDFIYMNHVLEHIPEDGEALAEVYRVLSPGGTLVLGVPNEGVAFWQLAYRLQPRIRMMSDHVNFYTSDTLRERCEQAGFTVTEIEHIGWGPPHWRLDALIRRFKWVDDVLEKLGRRYFREQATSLYAILTR